MFGDLENVKKTKLRIPVVGNDKKTSRTFPTDTKAMRPASRSKTVTDSGATGEKNQAWLKKSLICFCSRMPLRVQDPEALTGDFADDFASLASSQRRATAVSCALWLAGDFASLVSSQGSATAASQGFS